MSIACQAAYLLSVAAAKTVEHASANDVEPSSDVETTYLWLTTVEKRAICSRRISRAMVIIVVLKTIVAPRNIK